MPVRLRFEAGLPCPCAQLRKDTYNRLTPVQQLQVARHPNRPTFLDIALNITDKFVELHGDRAGADFNALAPSFPACTLPRNSVHAKDT